MKLPSYAECRFQNFILGKRKDYHLKELKALVDSGESILSVLENDVACVALYKSMKLKQIAIEKAEGGNWETASRILQDVLIIEKKSA